MINNMGNSAFMYFFDYKTQEIETITKSVTCNCNLKRGIWEGYSSGFKEKAARTHYRVLLTRKIL